VHPKECMYIGDKACGRFNIPCKSRGESFIKLLVTGFISRSSGPGPDFPG
jgi:hypothetical protein